MKEPTTEVLHGAYESFRFSIEVRELRKRESMCYMRKMKGEEASVGSKHGKGHEVKIFWKKI